MLDGGAPMETESLRALLLVVDHGSLAAAAAASGSPRSTLRRRIEHLEARLGMALFIRDTHGASPTPAARALAERARPVLLQLELLAGDVADDLGTDSGALCLRVPPGLPPNLTRQGILLLREACPGVRVTVEIAGLTDGKLPEHVDIALLIGEPPPLGPYRTRVLIRVPERLLASPRLLSERGPPRTPADLAAWPILSWRAGHDLRLPLLTGGELPIAPAVSSPDIHALRLAAAAGAGIAWVPDAPLADDEAPLTPVLPREVGGVCEVRLVVPERVAAMPRTRGAVDALKAVQELVMSAARGG